MDGGQVGDGPRQDPAGDMDQDKLQQGELGQDIDRMFHARKMRFTEPTRVTHTMPPEKKIKSTLANCWQPSTSASNLPHAFRPEIAIIRYYNPRLKMTVSRRPHPRPPGSRMTLE